MRTGNLGLAPQQSAQSDVSHSFYHMGSGGRRARSGGQVIFSLKSAWLHVKFHDTWILQDIQISMSRVFEILPHTTVLSAGALCYSAWGNCNKDSWISKTKTIHFPDFHIEFSSFKRWEESLSIIEHICPQHRHIDGVGINTKLWKVPDIPKGMSKNHIVSYFLPNLSVWFWKKKAIRNYEMKGQQANASPGNFQKWHSKKGGN